eukprot:861849-Prymnesium_polylepis.2
MPRASQSRRVLPTEARETVHRNARDREAPRRCMKCSRAGSAHGRTSAPLLARPPPPAQRRLAEGRERLQLCWPRHLEDAEAVEERRSGDGRRREGQHRVVRERQLNEVRREDLDRRARLLEDIRHLCEACARDVPCCSHAPRSRHAACAHAGSCVVARPVRGLRCRTREEAERRRGAEVELERRKHLRLHPEDVGPREGTRRFAKQVADLGREDLLVPGREDEGRGRNELERVGRRHVRAVEEAVDVVDGQRDALRRDAAVRDLAGVVEPCGDADQPVNEEATALARGIWEAGIEVARRHGMPRRKLDVVLERLRREQAGTVGGRVQ